MTAELKTKTADELLARQRLLEDELRANEEESTAMQAELDGIYAEQDRRRS